MLGNLPILSLHSLSETTEHLQKGRGRIFQCKFGTLKNKNKDLYHLEVGTNGTGKKKEESLYTETESEFFAMTSCISASESFKHFLLSEHPSW